MEGLILNNTIRTVIIWLIIPVGVLFAVVQFRKAQGAYTEVSFSDVVHFGSEKLIKSLKISPDKIEERSEAADGLPAGGPA